MNIDCKDTPLFLSFLYRAIRNDETIVSSACNFNFAKPLGSVRFCHFTVKHNYTFIINHDEFFALVIHDFYDGKSLEIFATSKFDVLLF